MSFEELQKLKIGQLIMFYDDIFIVLGEGPFQDKFYNKAVYCARTDVTYYITPTNARVFFPLEYPTE